MSPRFQQNFVRLGMLDKRGKMRGKFSKPDEKQTWEEIAFNRDRQLGALPASLDSRGTKLLTT